MPTLTILSGLPVSAQVAPDGKLVVRVDLAEVLDLSGSEDIHLENTRVGGLTDEQLAHFRTALARVRYAIEVKV